MNSLIESSSSSRRGSNGSLHRHTSGSFSSKSTNAQASNIKDPFKDLEKFTKYFVIKTVQVIVQSRIRAFKINRTESQPSGNDWFNINIKDIPELSDRTKKLLDQDGFNIKSNWKICCEISLKTQDGGQVVLEHWIINHKSLLKNYLGSLKEVNQIGFVKTSGRNSSSSISGSINYQQEAPLISPSSGRVRNATFNGSSRTRLDSIDDDTFSAKTRTNGRSNDIKPSTSCYTLSSQSPNGGDESRNEKSNVRLTSPTHHQSSPNNGINNTTSHNSKTKTLSTILSTMHLSTVYNRMTLLLKSILTTSHIVPAYQLVAGLSDDESCEINYRIYMTNSQQCSPSPGSNMNGSTSRAAHRDSIDDISGNRNGSNSPNRRSSISSNGSPSSSINIRDFVSPHEVDYFCPILNLGSAKSELNEIDVFLSYRTDVRSSFQLVRCSQSRGFYGSLIDRECIMGTKQSLDGNENKIQPDDYKGSSTSLKNNNTNDQPLRPAFADKISIETSKDPTFDLIEPMFDSLLIIKNDNSNSDENQNHSSLSKSNGTVKSDTVSAGIGSQPIEAKANPLRKLTGSEPENNHNNQLPNGSTPRSLTDSFVFVELNPPFASDEQNDINSFFHGPAPVFKHGYDCLKDAQEITNQLADIEADALQIDQFVDNICMSEFEDEEEEQNDINHDGTHSDKRLHQGSAHNINKSVDSNER